MGLEQRRGESTESLENLISKGLLTDGLRKLLSEEYLKKRESGIEMSLEDAYKQWIFSLLNTEGISKEQISKNQALVKILKRFFQEIKNISEENKDVSEEVRSLFINFFMSKIDDLQLGDEKIYDKCKEFYQETIGKSKESEESEDSKKIEIVRIVALFKSYLEWEKEYLTENKIETTVSMADTSLLQALRTGQNSPDTKSKDPNQNELYRYDPDREPYWNR